MDSEDGKLLAEIGRSSDEMKAARWSMFGYGTAGIALRVVVIGAGVGCVYLAYLLQPASFYQELAAQAGTGLLLFAAFSPVLRLAERHRTAVLIGGLVLAAVFLLGAAWTTDLTRSFLVDAAVSVLLLLALDLTIHRWLDAYGRAQGSALEKLKNAAAMMERAESALEYKYAIYDYLGLPRTYELQQGMPDMKFDVLGMDPGSADPDDADPDQTD